MRMITIYNFMNFVQYWLSLFKICARELKGAYRCKEFANNCMQQIVKEKNKYELNQLEEANPC